MKKQKATAITSRRLQEVPLLNVIPDKNQARQTFNHADVVELAKSIESRGLIQPLVVKPIRTRQRDGCSEKVKIIAGERRWRALRLLKSRSAPCIVIPENSKVDPLELQLIENVQREALDPVDEARAIKILMEKWKYSVADVARIIGRSSSYVYGRLDLLRLPEQTQDGVKNGRISLAAAKELAGYQPHTGEQKQALAQAAEPKGPSEPASAVKERIRQTAVDKGVDTRYNQPACIRERSVWKRNILGSLDTLLRYLKGFSNLYKNPGAWVHGLDEQTLDRVEGRLRDISRFLETVERERGIK